MPHIHIKKGLDLPITGAPEQSIGEGQAVQHVALIAADYPGMKPKMLCREGDVVRRGQPLFEDRKCPGVLHTAPAAGTVTNVNRGDRRALVSVVIALSEAEVAGDEAQVEHQPFAAWTGAEPAALGRDQVQALLLESGLWTTLRTRPFGRTPDPATRPAMLFVSVMDTRPLAPQPEVVLKDRHADFHAGLSALGTLCDGPRHLVRAKGSALDAGGAKGWELSEFSGPHPAGLVGTHMHFLGPVHRERVAWYVDYQSVAAIGALVRTGRVDAQRVVALAGPVVKKPRLLRTRVGASLAQLTRGELPDGELRVISGDVLSGRTAMGEQQGYLGRYDHQVSVLAEDRSRELFGWLRPGADRFSNLPTMLSALMPGKRFAMGTSTHGELRAIVPIGAYERVMPLDIVATYLLRALQTGDVVQADALGATELEEEDLALCTFVCPNKIDHQLALREVLDTIWKEGA